MGDALGIAVDTEASDTAVTVYPLLAPDKPLIICDWDTADFKVSATKVVLVAAPDFWIVK